MNSSCFVLLFTAVLFAIDDVVLDSCGCGVYYKYQFKIWCCCSFLSINIFAPSHIES